MLHPCNLKMLRDKRNVHSIKSSASRTHSPEIQRAVCQPLQMFTFAVGVTRDESVHANQLRHDLFEEPLRQFPETQISVAR